MRRTALHRGSLFKNQLNYTLKSGIFGRNRKKENMKNGKYHILIALLLLIACNILNILFFMFIEYNAPELDVRNIIIYSINLNITFFTIILSCYGVFFQKMQIEIEKEHENFLKGNVKANKELIGTYKAIINNLIIESRLFPIPRTELYINLLNLAKEFKRTACNCWFNARPPSSTIRQNRDEYFEKLLERAEKNQNTKLQRLILGTNENISWINELVEKYKDLEHVSLGVYCHKDKPLSVQIFDDDKALIVNRMDQGDTKDLLVKDSISVQILQTYFNDLWERSIVILESGKIKKQELQSINETYLKND